MKRLMCLSLKHTYAAAAVLSVPAGGGLRHRYLELRAKPTRHRGLVALTCSASKASQESYETMAAGFRISQREAREYCEWFYSLYSGRVFTVVELVDCVAREDCTPTMERDSWFPYGNWNYAYVWRQTSADYAPLLRQPDKSPLLCDVCVGCRSGRHLKPNGQVEGNYHIPMFEVHL